MDEEYKEFIEYMETQNGVITTYDNILISIDVPTNKLYLVHADMTMIRPMTKRRINTFIRMALIAFRYKLAKKQKMIENTY